MKSNRGLRLFRWSALLAPVLFAAAAHAQAPPGKCNATSYGHFQTFDAENFVAGTAGSFSLVETASLSVQMTLSSYPDPYRPQNAWQAVAVRYGPYVYTTQGYRNFSGTTSTITMTTRPLGHGQSVTLQMADGSKVSITPEQSVSGSGPTIYDVEGSPGELQGPGQGALWELGRKLEQRQPHAHGPERSAQYASGHMDACLGAEPLPVQRGLLGVLRGELSGDPRAACAAIAVATGRAGRRQDPAGRRARVQPLPGGPRRADALGGRQGDGSHPRRGPGQGLQRCSDAPGRGLPHLVSGPVVPARRHTDPGRPAMQRGAQDRVSAGA